MSDIGAALRAARQAAEPRISLARMATLTNFTKPYLSNIETGAKPASQAVVAAYERALGLADGALQGDTMYRRALLAGLGSAALSPATAAEAIRQSLTASLGPDAVIDDWQAIADRYGYTYMTDPAVQVRDALAADLISLRAALDGGPLHAVGARLAMVYGMVTATTGDTETALRWYRTGRALADESGDTWTREWTYGRSALTRGYEGADVSDVVATADRALALSDRASLGRLEAAIARAQALALAGDAAGARSSLELSYDLYEDVESAPDTSLYGMPEWRLHLSASLVLSRLGLAPDAERARDEAAKLIPATMTRFRAYLGLHEAIQSRDPDHATATLDAIPEDQRWVSFSLLAREAAHAA